ncbi:MAG: hypothetical protein Q8N47_24325 [Bryobacterales bacterium]|nr:hypothetical protein [Bryobacterales bacterium]
MIERSVLPLVDVIALTAAEYRQVMKECAEGGNTANHAGGDATEGIISVQMRGGARSPPGGYPRFRGSDVSSPYSANSALAP